MKTDAYVERGKWVTDHIGPINAVMTISTAVLIPVLDFLRPYFPYIGYVAVLAVMTFLILLAMKLLGIPKNGQLHSSLLLCSGVCAAAFSVGAIASARHADQGGLAAASFPWAAELQKTLFKMDATLTDIKNGKSDDPRVELKNIGVEWSPYKFIAASKTGDLRAVELFLKGGMPVTLDGSDVRTSLPYFIVSQNFPKAKEQLKLLQANHVDLNDPHLASRYDADPATQPPNLYALAKDNGRNDLADYLAELGVKTDSYPAWKKAREAREKAQNERAEKNEACFRNVQKTNPLITREPFVDYCHY
ncbi:hypothetical protein [Ralstonia insidiosa]|uniref:hypothetical protein n=1 Tax=Ralstonia insidiosa TaxID=190721 RepID=UPI001FC8EE64|nr:hypothetical protein [Ralstonia insidiosa]